MWVDMNFHVAGRQQVEVGRDGIIYIYIYKNNPSTCNKWMYISIFIIEV